MQRYVVAAALVASVACGPKPTPVVPPPTAGSGSAAIVLPSPSGGDTLATLVANEQLAGFTVVSLYLDNADKPIGARFVHDQTKFTFDYLRIESAPQGYLWVTTYPTSDKGEPHTQEHLLLAKGDRGRRLGSEEAMALVEESAFTEQWHTAYHFHTIAAPAEFWPAFGDLLDATLNPDETDEEIRREVRNFGIAKAGDGSLRLEEKGTVYNEMVRSYEAPDVLLGHELAVMTYGAAHPLAFESGGLPSGIRAMTPSDIRAFHDATYHLANMGMIAAFPSSLPLRDVLARTGAVLAKAAGRKGRVITEAELPKPNPAPPGTLRVVDYPYADATNAGMIAYGWPAARALDDTERLLLELFVDALAGDESTPLYQKLIDSAQRTIDLGASELHATVGTDLGQPVAITIQPVRADRVTEKTLADVRAVIIAELQRIAQLPDGDAELVAFVGRVRSRLLDARRRYAKLLDSPPAFGKRNIPSTWFVHLHQLAKHSGFAKSLTMRPELAAVDAILATRENPFRNRIAAWGLTTAPYGVAMRASPALREQLNAEREARSAGELARLQQAYGTKDAAATLARARTEYDAATAKLEADAKPVELPPLVASPPMTLDDNLAYDTGELGSTRLFTAKVDSMSSARIAFAFSLAGAVATDEEVFLAALPALLTGTGVIDRGMAISSADMKTKLREEVLELSARYIGNPRTHRVELQVAAAGSGKDESTAALAWLRRVLFAPDWRIDNLARVRDVVDKQLAALRRTMLGAEEEWMNNPREAWRLQSTLFAHTQAFLTQIHDLHRLRWMLLDPQDKRVTAEVTAWLATLAATPQRTRAQLVELAARAAAGEGSAAKLSPAAKALARAAGTDLGALLGDLPDASLARDWTYLCKQMARDLAFGAPAALARLGEARVQIVQGQRARLVQVGSTALLAAISRDVEELVKALPVPPTPKRPAAAVVAPFRARLAEHAPGAKPVFVGLLAPSTSSGVITNLAPSVAYSDTADDAVLDYLASNLYTGHGPHTMFAKTIAAGLAYSNGLHPLPELGALDYTAERCPLVAQTTQFVVDQLRAVKPDANIARYAIAKAFTSRVADAYETRAARMAADLVDELPPDVVRRFRSQVLAASKRTDLAQTLFARVAKVYAKVVPGLGALAPDATYFVIGNGKQLATYQDYLHAAVGKSATLYTLYPRDFWIPAKL